MVVYTDQDVIIYAPYKLTLKNTDSWWVNLQCLQNPNGYGWPGILEVNNHIKCLKSISSYGGALMTASVPGYTGGGAIQIGHAFERSDDPPRINLTDDGYHTLYITAGSSVGVGADAVLANIRAYDVEAKNAVKSWKNGTWLFSYYGGGGGGNNGGIALDAYGNAQFQGGSSSNSWHVFNNYGSDLFSIRNNPNGASYGNIDIHLNPYQDRTWNLGTSTRRWAGLAVWDIYYANLYDSWDSIDDLAYAKQFKGKTIIDADGKQRTIIDPDTLKMFKVDFDPNNTDHNKDNVEEMHDLRKVAGFMLSCHKAAAMKLDEHEANFAEVGKLKDEITELQAQIQALTEKIAV